MNTYYNTIYNGNLAIQNGINTVEENYPEDYWNILPLERMQEAPPKKDIFDTDTKQEEAKNPDFKRAEDKAVKAIQKHAMFIGGEEYNYQMDETFILLGKARYHSHRYIQAKDAFLYVLNHYPESSEIIDAKIWTEKVNMRLNYYEMALRNLTKIKNENQDLEDDEQTHLNSILAEAHILNENYRDAIEPLNEAIKYTDSDTLKGRLLYIKGQLFNRLQQKDSANSAFQQIVELNRRSPRTYMIHAKLEQIKNIDKDTASYAFMMPKYQELIENRENRPFLDFIYFDLAEYYNQLDSIDAAIDNYNKSLKRQPQDSYLYSRDYLRLAQIYFDKNKYKTAGAYYDSTLTKLDKSKREYRQIAKKRENLEDVIKYEDIAQEKDSILNLVEMTKEERLAFFEDYVDKLKEEAQSIFAQQSASKKMMNRSNTGISNFSSNTQSRNARSRNTGSEDASGNTSYYFYDSNQAQRGLLAFKQTWGNIELTDNWKYGGTRKSNPKGDDDQTDEDPFANDPKYNPETYLTQIPEDKNIIDTLWIDRNFAYYQLGVIYKEKFKEYSLAKNRFVDLLESNPEDRLILPSIYNLYLISEELNDFEEQNRWKNKILNEYPESEYATLLLNPEQLKNSENNPLYIYKRLYKDYENKQYNYVVEKADEYAKKFIGRPISPKFELLKAYAIAKIEGSEAYLEALNYVALTYPQSDEGKFAQKQYDKVKRNFKSKDFKADTENNNYKLVYYFSNNDELKSFQAKLQTAFKTLDYDFKTTEEVYNSNQDFLVIQGLSSKLGAEGLAEKLINENLISEEFDYFAISEENYSTIQIYKNLDEYLEQLNK
jgi:tetratricopeptide (TPR) repeat protein